MSQQGKKRVIAVVGPTASGKTALGVALARQFDGEIISCDSMQIYRGLPIGTAQPSADERMGVPCHLLGCIDPSMPFSVSDFVALAGNCIDEICSRNRLPLLVGGTGLYVRSLLRGFVFHEEAQDDALRRELFQRADLPDGPQKLFAELERVDPVSAANIHPHNVKRVIRALEYWKLTGEPFSNQAERSRTLETPYRHLILCLAFRDRQRLYKRIDGRVDAMLEQGLLKEAEMVYRLYAETPTAAQAIGYKEFFPYFAGDLSLAQAVEDVKRESRRYAKRQITWFHREPDAQFVYCDDFAQPEDLVGHCACLLRVFLRTEDDHDQ